MEQKSVPGILIINNEPEQKCEINMDAYTTSIRFHTRTGINIHTFGYMMLSHGAQPISSDTYSFDGPQLGYYHDTLDIREGPWLNHYINHLEIIISYTSSHEATITMRGKCDVSKSSYEKHYYNGPYTGDWVFQVSFIYNFSRT